MPLLMADRMMDEAGRYGGKRPEKSLVFDAPEAAKLMGDKGEALVRWVKQPNGQIMIASINGQPLSGAPAEPKEPDGDEDGEDDDGDGDGMPPAASGGGDDSSIPEFGGGGR